MFNLFGMSGFADANEAIEAVKSGKAALLDVRSAGEFSGGHAAGAKNLPVDQLTAGKAPKIDLDKPIYVYCQSGGRSSRAQAILTKMGFKNVKNIGGIGKWRAAGGVIE